MNTMLRKVLVCGALASMATFGATSAFGGPWSSPGGAADSFTYANGGDINGFFGEPYVSPPGSAPESADTFFFIGSNFQVQGANGTSESQFDEVSVDVFANPGLYFNLIRVYATGSYNATGPGENSVDIDAALMLTELGANDTYDGGLGDDGRSWTGNLDTSPEFPKSDANGEWSGLASVDITFEFPIPDDALHISMSNNVLAITGVGGSAQMNVQYQDLRIEFGVVPEPASLALLAVGGIALMRRRR
jgi:hypothetical protein